MLSKQNPAFTEMPRSYFIHHLFPPPTKSKAPVIYHAFTHSPQTQIGSSKGSDYGVRSVSPFLKLLTFCSLLSLREPHIRPAAMTSSSFHTFVRGKKNRQCLSLTQESKFVQSPWKTGTQLRTHVNPRW